MVRILAVCALAAVAHADDPQKRLNPSQDYLISNAQSGQARRGFTGEYFDLDTPHFRSQYAEVVWRMLPSVPLPHE